MTNEDWIVVLNRVVSLLQSFLISILVMASPTVGDLTLEGISFEKIVLQYYFCMVINKYHYVKRYGR